MSNMHLPIFVSSEDRTFPHMIVHPFYVVVFFHRELSLPRLHSGLPFESSWPWHPEKTVGFHMKFRSLPYAVQTPFRVLPMTLKTRYYYCCPDFRYSAWPNVLEDRRVDLLKRNAIVILCLWYEIASENELVSCLRLRFTQARAVPWTILKMLMRTFFRFVCHMTYHYVIVKLTWTSCNSRSKSNAKEVNQLISIHLYVSSSSFSSHVIFFWRIPW